MTKQVAGRHNYRYANLMEWKTSLDRSQLGSVLEIWRKWPYYLLIGNWLLGSVNPLRCKAPAGRATENSGSSLGPRLPVAGRDCSNQGFFTDTMVPPFLDVPHSPLFPGRNPIDQCLRIYLQSTQLGLQSWTNIKQSGL